MKKKTLKVEEKAKRTMLVLDCVSYIGLIGAAGLAGYGLKIAIRNLPGPVQLKVVCFATGFVYAIAESGATAYLEKFRPKIEEIIMKKLEKRSKIQREEEENKIEVEYIVCDMYDINEAV